MRGLRFLRDGGVELNVLTTVHAANERRGRDVYRFLRVAANHLEGMSAARSGASGLIRIG